jgi:hypothetical protein
VDTKEMKKKKESNGKYLKELDYFIPPVIYLQAFF